MKFRKKPVEIDALEFNGLNLEEVADFATTHFQNPRIFRIGDKVDKGWNIILQTLEGDMTAQPGDWIIRGVKGEIYPCKPDIFEMTYERA